MLVIYNEFNKKFYLQNFTHKNFTKVEQYQTKIFSL